MNSPFPPYASIVLFAALLSTGIADSAHAYDDPVARAEEREDLFLALSGASEERIANAAATAIWEHWQTAPDETSQRLLEAAQQRMRVYDYAGAMEHLDELVVHSPNYAEGWNMRATTLFLQERYDRSLDDVEKTLVLEPKHFGALSGKAMILMRQGRAILAQTALRKAVEIHPFLPERALLIEVPE